MLLNNITLVGGLTGRTFDPDYGQMIWTTPGTYEWVCPEGITSVCAVCVGAGGSNAGSLGWKNNISVVPGTTYDLEVGAPGQTGGTAITGWPKSPSYNYVPATPGGMSWFINPSLVMGGLNSYAGDGGGYGGSGGAGYGGGGGAGGYTGNGGSGGTNPSIYDPPIPGTPGTGGGGAGGTGRTITNWQGTSRGGDGGQGVSLFGPDVAGELGEICDDYYAGDGGDYGGAAGVGQSNLYRPPYIFAIFGGQGGAGAVRIIWGPGRAFPNTNVR